MKPCVSVIGYGRFGALWAQFLSADFEVGVLEASPEAQKRAEQAGFRLLTPASAYEAVAVFYAVPISSLEAVLQEHLPFLQESKALLVDLLSVKVYPKQLFERLLPQNKSALLMHPMFGPDSVAQLGFAGQKLVMDRYTAPDREYQFWKQYFAGRCLSVLEMTAEEHDRYAAHSQGVTHLFGRILGEFGYTPTPIDTLGAQKLAEICNQVCHDSWQLFMDLQTHNPFTLPMRVKVGAAQAKIYNQLLPNRIHKECLVVGIQGGRGSFNEEAARYYLHRAGVEAFQLRYLHTTENVLRALHEGDVDRGQFAVHNSAGGMVHESVEAMSRYTFHIIEEFAIQIAHALMVRRDANFERVDTVMAHPQVFRQCAKNLPQKYPKLRQISGEGELIDHAKVAELLGQGQLPSNIATMGSKVLADLHGLRIVEDNLQDLRENFTSFLWVERPGVY